MEEALLWSEGIDNGAVFCPYCYGVHTHGLSGDKTLIGQVKTSHCAPSQDYIIAAANPAVIMSALYRRKGELRRKREARARVRETLKAVKAANSPPVAEPL